MTGKYWHYNNLSGYMTTVGKSYIKQTKKYLPISILAFCVPVDENNYIEGVDFEKLKLVLEE